MALIPALGTAFLAVAVACSSGASGTAPEDAGSTGCTDTIVNVFNNNPGVACPVDANGNPEPYDDAITATCATESLKTGDVQYGQCFEYLVFEVDVDSSGTNLSKCFYDPGTHAFVGVIYGDGKGQDQCNGTSSTIGAGQFDTGCNISGLNGGGAGFQSCAPVVDAGGECSLLAVCGG
jgi:hypothetical protein